MFKLKQLSILIIIIFSLYSSAETMIVEDNTDFSPTIGQDLTCQDELNKRIREVLGSDKDNLLVESFNLASLKLSYQVLEDGGEKQTIESFIKKKIKQISQKDKNKLMHEVKKIYNKFGRQTSLNKISSLIDGLDKHNYFPRSKRLSNEENSIIMLTYKILGDCQSGDVCLNDDDIAITWLMDKISKKATKDINDSATTNLLESSVKVAHLTGALSSTKAFEPGELKVDIVAKSNLIQRKLNNIKEEFINDFDQCRDLLNASCNKNMFNNTYNKVLKDILEDLDKNKIQKTDKNLKLEVVKGVSLNLRNSLSTHKKSKTEKETAKSYPKKLNLPARIVNNETGPLTCGGDDFKSDIRNVKLFSFDPFRAVSTVKNYGKPKGAPGTNFGMICELAKLGPIQFHCTPWLKKLVLRKKDAEAKVCCNEKESWEEFTNLYASISGGIDLKAYLGVPFLEKVGVVGEIGLIGGVGAGISLGGGEIPEGCINKKCIQAAIRTSVFLGGYLDIGVKRKLNNAIGAEMKVAWKPYLTGRQCLYPQGNLPPMEVKYSVGSIWLHGTVYAGWVFTYDFYEPIYERHEEDSLSIPIF